MVVLTIDVEYFQVYQRRIGLKNLTDMEPKESAAGHPEWDTRIPSRMAAEQAIVAAKNHERWRKV